ncbi:DUF1254 domain-containing protein [Actinomadura scrupuli]|uniref:DUF1254 domain-containing protein n=1 Tax=Actinomadura scrupuli TaxID=559629 RepID=UPI003D98448D
MTEREDEVSRVAVDAWLFGYPLVLMELTRRVMTGTPRSADDERAPMNRFHHLRTVPDATFTKVVAPNVDTLYSSAWLDVGPEPIVLSVPDMGDRYWMMPMLSGWTDVFAAPGSRTTGQAGGHFTITGPGWSGTVPAGSRQVRSPTSLVWIIGRTTIAGIKDYLAVHALQDQMHLTPLSAWTGDPTEYVPPGTPPASMASTPAMETPPVDQIAALDGITFFTRLNQLMVANPPHPGDAAALERFGTLGIVPGGGPGPLSTAESINAVHRAPEGGRAALRRIVGDAADDSVNGWTIYRDLGDYGTDYAKRVLVAALGLGANLDADALYPRATVDATGAPLSGEHRYLLHFDAGERPPVNGFWSLTMYDDKQFFVANPIRRYAVGDRDPLQLNPDGSLDILVQHDPPEAGPEANWLPAPTGSFNVCLRCYWPKPSALSGEWTPPPLRRTG